MFIKNIIFCNIVKVFNVTFDQFNASWIKQLISFFKKGLNGKYYIIGIFHSDIYDIKNSLISLRCVFTGFI